MKTCYVVLSAFCLFAAAQFASGALTVSQDGTGDFRSIQAAVDAAADYDDTVYVSPGVYGEVGNFSPDGYDISANVFFEKSISLISTDGPGVTIIDGGGLTDYGIFGRPYPDWPFPGTDPPPCVIEGFTVRNGLPWWPSIGVVAVQGEARGNWVTDYYAGISSGYAFMETGIPEGGRHRSGTALIDGNVCQDNERGIYVGRGSHSSLEATVTNNAVSGNDIGVAIQGPSVNASLVGNEISANSTGINVSSGGSSHSGFIGLEFFGNTISYNTTQNINVYCNASIGSYALQLTMGGAIGEANDVLGSPVNLSLTDQGGNQLVVDASFNYWGSTSCEEFEPLFVVSGVPDTNFTYFPYLDEPHLTIYGDCSASNIDESVTWGAIKSLYR